METVDAPPPAVARGALARGPWRDHAPLLAVLVGAAVAYVVLALLQPVPLITPDEFTYGHVARSLGHGEGFTWRGAHEPFRSALYLYAIAPFWGLAAPTTAYALSKVLGAIALCTLAIPVWVLARRLLEDRALVVACVALSVLGSWMTTAGNLATEDLALPLATASLVCCVLALRAPGGRAGLLAIGFALLATWARAQLVVLLAALAVAFVLDVALASDRAGRARAHRVVLAALGVLAGIAVVVAVASGSSALGSYAGLTALKPPLGRVLSAAWRQWLAVVLACGAVPVVLAGAALLGPGRRDRDVRVLALVTGAAVLAVVAQSGWYLAGIHATWAIQRYVEYPVPLLIVLAVLVVARGLVTPRGIGVAAVAVAAMLLTQHGARRVIEERALYGLHHVVGASRVSIPLLVLALAGLAALALARLDARRAVGVLIGLIAAPLLVQAVVGWSWQIRLARDFRAQFPSLTWVDDHGRGPVARMFVFANEPLFDDAELFSAHVHTVLTPPPPFRGRSIQGGTCGWTADASGAVSTDGSCLAGVRRVWNDDPLVRMSFYGGRTVALDRRLGQMIAVPGEDLRLRSLLVLPCNVATLRISRSAAHFSMPRAVSCGGFLQATTFLDAPGRLVLRFRGGTSPHRVTAGGRSWALPAGAMTTVALPVQAGAGRTTLSTNWRTTAGAPELVAAEVRPDGGPPASLL